MSFFSLNACGQNPYIYAHDYQYNDKIYKVFKVSETKTNKLSNRIKAIDLSGEKSAIPPEILKMSDLIYLDLRNKDLQALPGEICNLNNLKVLFLGGNELREIPECFYQMETLEVITILGCNMKTIPKEFSNFKNLKLFAIGGNNYSKSDVSFLKEKLPDCNIIYSVD